MENTKRKKLVVRLPIHILYVKWPQLIASCRISILILYYLSLFLVWENVYGFDYTPLRETALAEPLVDNVEMKAVVTDPAKVLTLDLYTCKPDDLAFNIPFGMRVRRDDFVHALVAWFDIDFTACHKPISFSTGPHTKYTHWKQTVFYFREVLTVQEGEEIQCVLSVKPNTKNRRDLDIEVSYSLDSEDPTRKTSGKCEYKMC